MKKIINKPENYVNEMLEGLYIAHPDLITYTADDLHCLVSADRILKSPGNYMMQSGLAIGSRRPFVEYKRLFAFSGFYALFENVNLIPVFRYSFFIFFNPAF